MAVLSPRAAALYPKYDKDWFANRVAELEEELARAAAEINCAGPVDHRIRVLKQEYAADLEVAHASRRIQKGLSDTQIKRQAETIKECHERTAELAIRIQDLKNVS